MKNVTLKDLEWQKDPHYFTPTRTKSYYGRARDVQAIVIHWWNEPDRAGTLEPTADYLDRADTSIHFIVSGDRIIQMVNMGNTAFHARSANPISVGIEVDPNTPGNTYETVGALVKFIRTYYGNIPLKRHSDYVRTSCPGTVSLKKIEQYASGTVNKTNERKVMNKKDLDAAYLHGPLGRKRSGNEGEDVYLGKSAHFVLSDHARSPEGQRRLKRRRTLRNRLAGAKKANATLKSQVDARDKRIKALNKQVTKLKAAQGNATKWDTLKALLQELIGA